MGDHFEANPIPPEVVKLLNNDSLLQDLSQHLGELNGGTVTPCRLLSNAFWNSIDYTRLDLMLQILQKPKTTLLGLGLGTGLGLGLAFHNVLPQLP